MPPNSNDVPYVGSAGFERAFTAGKVGADDWLDRKREEDGAEGLWRVHDDLYDFTKFVKRHPGGAQWLELTRGTDITEAFEAHHILETAAKMLKKFHVREALTPRNSPFTFEEDGFYRTLKRNVRPFIRKLPKNKVDLSGTYSDSLCIATFVLSTLACRFWSYSLGIAAGVALSCLVIAAHNYFHKKDNWRMYYFNLSLMSYREWRISHALSHHLYTNTVADLEITSWQDLIEYFPKDKSVAKRFFSWVYFPLLWTVLFHVSFFERVFKYVRGKDTRGSQKSDAVAFILPAVMCVFGGQSLMATVGIWSFIIGAASFHFMLVGGNAAHHHPDIFHDGDTPREERDWGIAQLDTVADRNEITGNHFLVLTNFGDHCLHHMFPTLDHGVLNDLYPIFKETMKEFDVDLRMTSQLEMVKGHFLQLTRNKPNPNPPNLLQKMKATVF